MWSAFCVCGRLRIPRPAADPPLSMPARANQAIGLQLPRAQWTSPPVMVHGIPRRLHAGRQDPTGRSIPRIHHGDPACNSSARVDRSSRNCDIDHFLHIDCGNHHHAGQCQGRLLVPRAVSWGCSAHQTWFRCWGRIQRVIGFRSSMEQAALELDGCLRSLSQSPARLPSP